MDFQKISNEIMSPALKEIAKSLHGTVKRVQKGEIDYRQAGTEVAGHKHLIQILALDWGINNTIQKANTMALNIEARKKNYKAHLS